MLLLRRATTTLVAAAAVVAAAAAGRLRQPHAPGRVLTTTAFFAGPPLQQAEEPRPSLDEVFAGAKPAEVAVRPVAQGAAAKKKMATAPLACTPWEQQPYDPQGRLEPVERPWERPEVCKMYVEFSDGSKYFCSGTLVEGGHLVTARHCTFNPCKGEATAVTVACGAGAVEGSTDAEAHLGTARAVRCTGFAEYDSEASCFSHGDTWRWDLQICELDRMLAIKGVALSAESTPVVEVTAYPADMRLSKYFAGSTRQMFTRTAPAECYAEQVMVDGGFVVAGESGGGYFSEAGELVAVHTGGSSGCFELGRRITPAALQLVEEHVASAAPKPPHCEVVAYVTDHKAVLAPHEAPRGVRALGGSVWVPTQLASTFEVSIMLHNPGTLPTGKVKVIWYASANDWISKSDTQLTVQTYPAIPAGGTLRAKAAFAADWPPGETRYLGAVFSDKGACLPSAATNWVLAGSVQAPQTEVVAQALWENLGKGGCVAADPDAERRKKCSDCDLDSCKQLCEAKGAKCGGVEYKPATRVCKLVLGPLTGATGRGRKRCYRRGGAGGAGGAGGEGSS